MTAKQLKIALVGYANVGKSVLFNNLTGLHQHVGNWPGKTVDKSEGQFYYQGYNIQVLDLPGFCSFSVYSTEEQITKAYIVSQEPDFLVNILDAANLESNLILTLQLLELGKHVVIGLNMIDLANKKGIFIDVAALSRILKTPVVPLIARTGKGATELLDQGISLVSHPQAAGQSCNADLLYGKEVEGPIRQLVALIEDGQSCAHYPARFMAIKLLEKDKDSYTMLAPINPAVLKLASQLSIKLNGIHGHDSSLVIADERANLASRIVRQVVKYLPVTKPRGVDLLEKITVHAVLGYLSLMCILGLIFVIVFKFGAICSSWIADFTLVMKGGYYQLIGANFFTDLLWSGIESLCSLVEIGVPIIFPFYLLLFSLESCGYLARLAYLADNFMHRLGIHGKACMPLILGLGCNVPACLGCRILETERERFITGLLATFVPCGAVTVVIAGLVGKYLGSGAALALYGAIFIVMVLVGKIASWLTPGPATALIMQMPDYRWPSFATVMAQTWIYLKEFIISAAPAIVVTGVAIHLLTGQYLLATTNQWLSPLVVGWLHLPEQLGIILVLGLLRKELMLVTLAMLLGTHNLNEVLSSTQIMTLAVLTAFYVPCSATIGALWREFGYKRALAITGLKIILAITLAGGVRIFSQWIA